MSNLVVHFEIHGSEPQVLITFYSQLFGWRFTQFDDMLYWSIDTGEGSIGMDTPGIGINGGLTQRRGPKPESGAPVNGSNIVVGVDDADAFFAKGLTLGAHEALPLDDMPGVGRVGYLLDPDGNVFGLISPVRSDGTNVMEATDESRSTDAARSAETVGISELANRPPAHLEHKGRTFTLDQTDDAHWQIRNATGVLYGTLAVESASGESNDPVYNGYTPTDDDAFLFGSDWDAIVRGLINQYDADHAAP